MAKASKQKRAQKRVLDEIKNQLILQAERWGRVGYYTPLKLTEMVLEQCRKIKGDFLAEKANLEYELHRVGTDKKECLIKLEKIQSYLKKADRVIARHQKSISKMLDKLVGNRDELQNALSYVLKEPKVSVLIGDN